jgi:hypothetical protein
MPTSQSKCQLAKYDYIVTIFGVWIVNGFTEHLYTQLVTTSNCSTIANSHSAIHYSTLKVGSRDSAIGIATGYGVDD